MTKITLSAPQRTLVLTLIETTGSIGEKETEKNLDMESKMSAMILAESATEEQQLSLKKRLKPLKSSLKIINSN